MLNGDLKSLASLWCGLATNQRYSAWVVKEDISTFNTRVSNEGLSFLTVVLPSIGKAVDSFHSVSEWVSPIGFASRSVSGPDGADYLIPIFLGCAVDAALKGDSCAVECVRQLTLMFYKLEVQHSDDVVEEFLDQFIKTDEELPSISDILIPDKVSPYQVYPSILLTRMKNLIAEVLCNTDPKQIRPSHGGGATACHTANKDKQRKFRYIERLDNAYPYDSHFFFSPSHLVDEMDTFAEVETVLSPHARVCLVPKDSRGPRIISCEPAEFMFIQQGLMELLYRTIETHYLTSGQVNFLDQSTNRELACQGSISGAYSTIDLSEASDRVSLELVEYLFPPIWVECFTACRSESTDLPNGKTVKLRKFAPMGSSCCFPVEALVFWACAEASIRGVAKDGSYVFHKTHSSRSIFVYGDDIICPTEYFDRICDGLETIGLKINRHKSYKAGPFRESCGGDYHLGVDVTPVRVRFALSSDGIGIVRNADLANLFIAKFGESGSRTVIDIIEDAQGYPFPRTLLALPATVRLEPSCSNDVFFARKWNKDLHRFEYRTLAQHMDVKTYHPADWWELLRKELSRRSLGSSPDVFTSLVFEERREDNRYGSSVRITNSRLDPGQYADIHTARMKWTWTWLG